MPQGADFPPPPPEPWYKPPWWWNNDVPDPTGGRGPGRGDNAGGTHRYPGPGHPPHPVNQLSPLASMVHMAIGASPNVGYPQRIVRAAKHGKLFDPSGTLAPWVESTGPAAGEAPFSNPGNHGPEVLAQLQHLDTLGDQRRALPAGAERRGVRKQIKQAIHRPNPGGI